MTKRNFNPPPQPHSHKASARETQRAEKVESLLSALTEISEEERDYLRKLSSSTKLEAINSEFFRSSLAARRWKTLCERHPLPPLEDCMVRGRKIGRKLAYPFNPPEGLIFCASDGGAPRQEEMDAFIDAWIQRESEAAKTWVHSTISKTENALRKVEDLSEDAGLPSVLEKSKLAMIQILQTGDLTSIPDSSHRIVWFFSDAGAGEIRLLSAQILEVAHPWMRDAAAHTIANLLGNADPPKLSAQLDHLLKSVMRLSELIQKTALLCDKVQNQKAAQQLKDLFKGDCRLNLREKKLAQGIKDHLSRARKDFLEQAREEISELLGSSLPGVKVKSDSKTALAIERPVEFVEKMHGMELVFNFPAKTRIDISEAAEKAELAEYIPLVERLLKESSSSVRQKGKQFLSKIRPTLEKGLQTPGVELSDLQHLFVDKPWLLGGMAYDAVDEAIEEIVQRAQQREAMSRILSEHNLDKYRELFPVARRLGQRKLIFLAGPTNSGKTYHGLNLLAEFKSGVYLAPLRLLALEGQEELFKRGVKASFLTGEERDIVPEAQFTASTIEMLNLHQVVEAALIDEIQLLTDRGRGWAWTQAFIGVPAGTVIMTGSANAIPLVQRLAQYAGEEVEVREFSRLTPLEPLPTAQSAERPEPGTALIAFSRRDVLELREQLRANGINASVIYGNLSPDVRREEARRFRNGETQVLVATDAIGMGLNLPIKKVVFHTLTKFDGREPRPLTDAEILQIAGRAGRYQKYSIGYAGATTAEEARRIAQVLRIGTLPMPWEKVFVQPTADFMLALRQFLPEVTFLDALLLFRSKMRFDDSFIVPVVTDDMFELARIVDTYAPLKRAYREQVEDLFQWICSPVDTQTSEMAAAYIECLRHFLDHRPIHPGRIVRVERNIANNHDLLLAEIAVKILTLYCWLGYRYPRIFPDLDEAESLRGEANRAIENALLFKKLTRACRECGKPLPPLFKFAICDRCYRSRSFRWQEQREYS